MLILFKYINADIFELIKKIQNQCVSNEKQAELILTTGHKSKGLEWDNVEIMDDFFNIKAILKENNDIITIPKEEINLLYVAITRARKSLIINQDFIIDDFFIEKNKNLEFI